MSATSLECSGAEPPIPTFVAFSNFSVLSAVHHLTWVLGFMGSIPTNPAADRHYGRLSSLMKMRWAIPSERNEGGGNG